MVFTSSATSDLSNKFAASKRNHTSKQEFVKVDFTLWTFFQPAFVPVLQIFLAELGAFF
jgi:hypothetical protein